MDTHEELLYLVLFERASGLYLHLEDGAWNPVTCNWPTD